MTNTKYFILTIALLLVPGMSQAFTASNQTATVLEDNAAVFTLDYSFTSNDRALYVPVFGNQNPTNSQFGWRVRANDEPGQVDGTAGFVVSDAPIVNGFYMIAPNTTETFTAIMIVIAPERANTDLYHTDINSMPFYIGEGLQAAPLNPSELQTFVTPSVAL